MESSSDELQLTPSEILNEAKIASESLLPKKSTEKYLNAYEAFIQWRTKKKATSFSENVLMAYFSEISAKYKPSTLWSIYSMLKTTMKAKNNVNINQYAKLTAFLKRKSDGFKSKKSKVLSANDVRKFIDEAPDNQYLATKVALIFGITGACRREELVNISVENVKQQGQIIIVKIPDTKTKIPRTFVIEDDFFAIVKKYEALRSDKCKNNRFFQSFRNGKCINQCIGINTFGAMPRQIATYLNLPEAQLYTGHSFRRTSATLLADSGASLMTLKRHGGWKSNSVAESYIEDSIQNKRYISASIAKSLNVNSEKQPQPSSSEQLNRTTGNESRPSTSKQPDIDTICTDSETSFLTEQVKTDPQITKPAESYTCTENKNENPHDISKTNLSQKVKFAGQNLTFNLQNCSNINFNFTK